MSTYDHAAALAAKDRNQESHAMQPTDKASLNTPNEKFLILIAGRSEVGLHRLESALVSIPGTRLMVRTLEHNASDPLAAMSDMPDLLLLDLSEDAEEELDALSRRNAAHRPPTLVVGPGNSTDLMRQAMRAGARDYFVRPIVAEDIATAARQILTEKLRIHPASQAPLFAVINAKGGSGASLIACNLAHIMAERLKLNPALLDFDFQFGSLGLNLDVAPEHHLMDVLPTIEQIDAIALGAYMARHKSGLHLLSNYQDDVVLPGEIELKKLSYLVQLVRQNYQYVVVDLPRVIDSSVALVLEQAEKILLVTQQSLAHVRDTKRLIGIMTGELEIPSRRITVVVNRFDKKNPLQLKQLEETLRHSHIATIPSDYFNVATAANLGRPLYDLARGAEITRALVDLAEKVSERRAQTKAGMVQRLLSIFHK